MTTSTWHGRRGAVLLGPTEARVARYLDHATRFGRVTLPMRRIRDDLALERSEAYRIVGRLRILGLFGVENDRGHSKGGRRIWRTARPHDGNDLDPVRHRDAWSRIVGWARRRRARVTARLAAIRTHTAHPGPDGMTGEAGTPSRPSERAISTRPAPSFGQLLRRAAAATGSDQLLELMDSWPA